ncbi:MAG: ABC transporter permease [Gammaproteobacteria bacterium]|nr:ABC transporter permease [Gammaproteobacteria bacterium]
MPASLYWVVKAVFSHYWRHRWQTLFLLVGLVAGVGLWSAVQLINQQARLSYAEANSLLGVQASYWIRSRSDAGVKVSDYISLRRAGFRRLFPLVEAEVSTQRGEPVSIIATDLLALPNGLLDGDKIDHAINWLEFVQPPYRAWIPQQLADELNLEKNSRLQLRDGRLLPPALIQSHAQQGRQVLMDIAAAFELLNVNTFSYLALGDITPDKLKQLRTLLPGQLELVENHQHLDLQQLTESLHTHLSAMSLLSFAVGLFIVLNAVRFSLWYRRPTFLNLHLIGVSPRLLITAILLETMFWSIIGTAAGLLIGLQVGRLLLPGLSASLHSLYDATIDTQLLWQFDTVFKAWGITLLGLCWALAWPLYRQLKQFDLPNLTWPAAVLVACSIMLYPHLHDAFSGFLILGMLLFSAAWFLPSLLALSLHTISYFIPNRLLISRWLVSDGWSQLPALRTAMMALLLAMTANLGVGTLVDSFRNAFVGWLEVRQSADIYLRSSQVDFEQLLDPQHASNWLQYSHRRIGVTTRWQSRQTLVRGVDKQAPDSLNLPLAQWSASSPAKTLELWQTDSNSLLANEQAHYLGGLQLGDKVNLETANGTKSYRVLGFFYDYGNPYFQFYLSREEVMQQWPQYYSRGVALWLHPQKINTTQLAEAAMRAAGASSGDWISQSQVRRLSLNIFERTFTITAAMNALTMMVAAIALLASLLAILQERLPQFAQWRALGVRNSEQLLIIACPILIFVSVTLLLAIPLGALLSWLLIYKLNIVSFGWSMPMLWEITPALRLAGVTLLVVCTTLAITGWQLRRKLPDTLAQLGEMG